MGGSKAKQSQSSTQTTTTTQIDRRVGVSEGSLAATEGSTIIGGGITELSAGRDVTVQSLDPETIAGALGLSRDVAEQLTTLAGGALQQAFQGAERGQAEVAKAFDRFGTDLGAITERTTLAAQTKGVSEQNKFLLGAAGIGGAVFVVYLLSKGGKG